MKYLCDHTGKSAKLFPFTTAQYRKVFKCICTQLQLSDLYVPHSLRHGGATRYHLLGHTIGDVELRGRWASSKSARRYIQSGRAMLMSVDIPTTVSSIGAILSQDVFQSFQISLSQMH